MCPMRVSIFLALCGLLVVLPVESGFFTIFAKQEETLDCVQRACLGAYDKINEFLTKEVRTDDVNENMRAIEKWLNEETADEVRGDKATLVRAMTQFHELSLKDEVEECTKFAYRTLLNNNLAMRHYLQNMSQRQPRRIERILYHYAVKFDKKCDQFHKSKYVEVSKDLKEETRYRVENFIGSTLTHRLRQYPELMKHWGLTDARNFIKIKPFEASRFAAGKQSARARSDPNLTYRWLYKFMRKADRPDVLRSLHNSYHNKNHEMSYGDKLRLANTLHKEISEPCRDYVRVFKEAFNVFVSLVDEHVPNLDDPIERKFYEDLTYFRGCEKYLKEEGSYVKDIEKVISNQKSFFSSFQINS